MTDKSDFTCEICHLKSSSAFQKWTTDASNMVKLYISTYVGQCQSNQSEVPEIICPDIMCCSKMLWQTIDMCIFWNKHDMYGNFKEFDKLVANKFRQFIKILRSVLNSAIEKWMTIPHMGDIKKENTVSIPEQNWTKQLNQCTNYDSCQEAFFKTVDRSGEYSRLYS